MEEHTAALVVIGNEILSGKTDDTNSRFLIGELRELGVRLLRIVVVPDDLDDIAAAVAECHARYDYVFTSGGVGPTHDDLTMAGIARAFRRKITRHAQVEALLRAAYGARLTERHLRMADLPEGAILVGGERHPVVALENIFILPGVPQLFRRKFAAIRDRFKEAPFHLKVVHSSLDEGHLGDLLEELVGDFPEVEVGSYPRYDGTTWRVKITLESRLESAVEQAHATLVKRLGAGVIHEERPGASDDP